MRAPPFRFDIASYRPRIITAWLILIALLGGVLAAHLELRTDLSAFLPYARTPSQELLIDQIREGLGAQLVLAGLEGGEADALARTSFAFADRLRANPAIASVANGPESLSEQERRFLFENRYLLLPGDQNVGWETSQLREALEHNYYRLVSSLGTLERDFVVRDPTAEWRRLTTRGQSGRKLALHRGAWLSPSKDRALLLIRTKVPAFDLDAQEQMLDQIRRDYSAVAPASMRLLLTGPGVFAVSSRDTIKSDALRLSVLGNTAVILLLLYVFRSLRPVLLMLLPLSTGVLAGIVAVIAVYGFVHAITLAFGVTLTGIAIDYPLHVLMHRRLTERPERTIERIWPTLRLGIVTTCIGYIVLLLADIQGLAQLGLMSTVAIIVAGLVTRWVLPAFLGPAAPRVAPVPFGAVAAPRLRLAGHFLVPLSLVASGVYMFGAAPQFWQNDLAELSPIAQDAKEVDRVLRTDIGSADARYAVLVLGKSAQEVLERCEELLATLEMARREQALSAYEGPCMWLPSIAAQRRRQATMPDTETLRSRLHEAGQDLPFRAGVFEPFVADVAASRERDPITPEDVTHTAFGARLQSLLLPKGTRWMGVVQINGVAESDTLKRFINGDGEHLFYLDMKRTSEQMVAGFRDRALKLELIGLLGIFVVLSLGLRSLRRALRFLLVLGGVVLLVCTSLLLTGQRISLFHLVALLLVIGIGLDYLLFFNRPSTNTEEKQRSMQAVCLCALTTLLAFGVLAMSRIPVLSAIGSTVALGSITCFALAALYAMPSTSPLRTNE